MEQAQLYLLLSPFALVLIALCLVCALANRKKAAFVPLIRFIALVMLTIILSDMELRAIDGQSIMFWSHMTYSCVPFIPVAWFFFCLDYSERERKPKANIKALLLMIIPVLTAAFAWTNDFHRLLWTSHDFIRDGGFLVNRVNSYGPWFWVYSAYSYLLYFAGVALILKDVFSFGKTRRRESAAAIVGVSIPVAINLIYLFRLLPGIRRDYSPLAFSASILFFLISIATNRRSETDEKGKTKAESEEANGTLTRRERDVYELLAKEMTTKEISDILCISENTVKTHTKHIYEKLHVNNKKELTETVLPR
jgi:DNA-binding CsgD family transcriptional regulator